MFKRHRLLLSLCALLGLLVIAVVMFAAVFDWNRIRPWVQTRIGDAIGRSVAIDGDLVASWHWRSRFNGETHWSPNLQFTANQVRIGNPDWAARPYLAELQAVEIDLGLLSLLRHEISIRHARLQRPSLDFERRKDATNNWTFTSTVASSDSTWTFDIGEIEFDAGKIVIADAERELELHAEITALDAPIPFGQHVEGDDPSTRREVVQRVGRAAAARLREAAEQRSARASARGRENPPPYVFGWTATGTMRGKKIAGSGRFGGVLALKDASRPFPVRADIDVGSTEIALTGTITDPTSPDAIDMRLWITGPDLAQLYPMVGLVLPKTPPYATVGRLAGRFHPHRSLLRYEDFASRVGGSDLQGTLTYKSGAPRATLTGEIDSTLLQFKDLGVLIGAEPAATAVASGGAGKVLPAEPFDVERWNAMDADVHFTGKRVIRETELPIRDVDTRIAMKDAVFTLDPLRFGMAGGDVKASLHIDANARPAKANLVLDARKLQLRRLFEKLDGLSTSLGDVNGTVRLAGSGNSIAALFGSSNGSFKLLMTDGRISEALMEKAGLNLANVLLAKFTGDRQIHIDCAAADFTAKDGVLSSNLFVFDTDSALVDIDGHVSLTDEKVDLTLHPHTKGLRIFSLRSPLHVQGSFRQLDVSVDKKRLLARGGIAIGLGLIAAPLAALVPLTAPSGDTPKSCSSLMAKATEAKPQGSSATAERAVPPGRIGRRNSAEAASPAKRRR
ncbi:MAG: AsmA family protein [Dokdonella sp.]